MKTLSKQSLFIRILKLLYYVLLKNHFVLSMPVVGNVTMCLYTKRIIRMLIMVSFFQKLSLWNRFSKVSVFRPPKYCCRVNEQSKCIKFSVFTWKWCRVNDPSYLEWRLPLRDKCQCSETLAKDTSCRRMLGDETSPHWCKRNMVKRIADASHLKKS